MFHNTSSRLGINPDDAVYWFIPVCTGTTLYKAVRESHGRTYWYVPVHTSTYTQEDKLFSDSSIKSQER